ncbi:MAG TPA: 3D domain-containing protein [Bryobacteraceae bacterium]|nr:3D domain-containing protein [Bryobacteraceae bacterium]
MVRLFLQGSILLLFCGLLAAKPPDVNGRYIATAYSVSGKTASGEYTQRHIVAADPAVLPIGSVIKIKHAGRYSGEYVVADTGEKIVGRKLDIFIPSTKAAMKFGRKRVSVTVVQLGNGTHLDAKQAVHQVKQDVNNDVEQGVAGNAATETDLVKQGEAKSADAQPSNKPQTPNTGNTSNPKTPPQ